MLRYEEDMIIGVHDKWTGKDTFYDAECANEQGIVGDPFDPTLEVQINGTLPQLHCDACGAELTPDPQG